MGKKAGVLFFLAGILFYGNVWAEAPETPVLSDSQCIICHKEQPATIAAHGAKHKTEVGCVDCHTEHPPAGQNAVPECGMCHSNKPHYELENCGSCHSDTHAPMNLKIEGDVTGPCLTCHEKEGKQLQAHPSAHTDVACSECHVKHRFIPDCMECHTKHTEDMNLESCLACHPVHTPLEITYGDDTASHYCTSCHEDAGTLLKNNNTKHKDLSCVYCHRVKHKTVPSCVSCKIPHGKPHPAKMLEKFPECGQCHGIAHNIQK